MTDEAAPLRVLFVCTANRARSPLAEGVARRVAGDLDAPLAPSSAGFLGPDRPVLDEMVRAAIELDLDRPLDLRRHRSRTVDGELVRRVDLVVAMEAEHLQRLMDVAPDRAPRFYRLRELAGLVERLDPPVSPTREGVLAWLDRLPARGVAALVDGSLDTPDPVGGSRREFRRCAEQVRDDVTAVVDGWFAAPSGGRTAGRR